ncbi:acyltransferase family protein [Companilactobacillus baiquanensis]|uniref:Acyltransferase family protein n=1 Tax=Companilactobacillus baiquanensis TaxID=2486005 RepID=A0ABW1UX47_9LACO|nr:acyltransferase [Companilactobacillus baiquanensis]
MSRMRNSNIELLRILSMLFITLHHFSLWAQGPRSDALIASNQLTNAFYSLFYLPLGDIGVYAFVMITGFYMGANDYNEEKTFKKALNVYLQLYFYSFLFLMMAVIKNWSLTEDSRLFKSLLPFIFNHYWFVTAYILLMLFIPYINKAIMNLTKRRFVYLLIILIGSCSIFPLINNNVASESVGLGILITAYLIGTFIRRFVDTSNKINYLIGIGLFLVNLSIIYGKMYFDIIVSKNRYTNIYTGFFALICSIGLFLIFVSMKSHYSSIINQLAKHVFAIYLITENIFVLPKLWSRFYFSDLNNLVKVNLFGFLSVILIMLGCYLIDLVRSEVFVIFSRMFKFSKNKQHENINI